MTAYYGMSSLHTLSGLRRAPACTLLQSRVVFFLGRSGVVLVKARVYHGPVWLPQAKPCP